MHPAVTLLDLLHVALFAAFILGGIHASTKLLNAEGKPPAFTWGAFTLVWGAVTAASVGATFLFSV